MNIILLPLDERPVNTRYPAMIAAIAGAQVLLPPSALLPRLRQPADRAGLAAWLRDHAAGADALIVSVEMLAYGGLIASRISHDDLAEVLAHLNALAAARAVSPAPPMYAFNVITRISDADYALEEPEYWAGYGSRLHRYSQWLHRAAVSAEGRAELDALRAALPRALIDDFTQRRLRNHAANLAVMGMAARGALDLLVLSSDDTSEFGMGSQEKAWLRTWAERLALDESRLLMYPGADEVGCVLLMRAVLRGAPPPSFYVEYAVPEDSANIAPYEDSAVSVTVERQIRALGGIQTADPGAADFIVAVNPPSRIGAEYNPDAAQFAAEHARRAPFIQAFVGRVADWVAAGRRVIVCDVGYPNGSDPDLIAGLFASVDLARLAAYGAWNTAGNTIGTALAQGAASALARTPEAAQMQRRFLLHRFLEDWGYQHIARAEIRAWLGAQTGVRDTTPDTEAEAVARIHARLNALLPQMGALADGWRISAVRLPWQRTFEVDFDLERA